MRPGETTPAGQVISVAPTAMGAQSQAAQVIWPVSDTNTWPPRSTSPGVRMVPVMSLDPSPAATLQVPLAGDGMSARGQLVIFGPASPVHGASGMAPSETLPSLCCAPLLPQPMTP